MSTKMKCFFITPFGDFGSEERKNSDRLLDLVIKPPFEAHGIEVIRGDRKDETGKIDIDTINYLVNSEFCIADLSEKNPNVYYEVGRRDETNKPIILLKSIVSEDLPSDIKNRRYISFDFNDLDSLIKAKEDIEVQINAYLTMGIKRKEKNIDLYSLNEILERIDRNLSRLQRNISFTDVRSNDWEIAKEDPLTILKVGLVQKNIPMAESAMNKLQFSMDEVTFYDYVVEQVAALGSRIAGEMLINYLDTFMDSVKDVKKRIEYIGAIITYLVRTNEEPIYQNKIEEIALRIKNDDGSIPDGIYNQLNRLYFGLYGTTNDSAHLDKAITCLEKAIELNPNEPSYYYNLALVYKKKIEGLDDGEEKDKLCQIALENSSKAVDLAGEPYDEDHLSLACRFHHQCNNPKWLDYLELLQKISPYKALLLKRELEN